MLCRGRDGNSTFVIEGGEWTVEELEGNKRRREVREAPTSEAEVEQPCLNDMEELPVERQMCVGDIFRVTTGKPCVTFPLAGSQPEEVEVATQEQDGSKEKRATRKRRTSLLGKQQLEESKDKLRPLEDLKRAGMATTVNEQASETSQVGTWSNRFREQVKAHNFKASPRVYENKTYSKQGIKAEVHENTQGRCTEVLVQMLGSEFEGEHRQASDVVKITAKADIAVYCYGHRPGSETGDAIQCRKKMHNGTTRVLLIARRSDTTAHCIGLMEAEKMRMGEWDRMLGHTQLQQPFALFSRDDD